MHAEIRDALSLRDTGSFARAEIPFVISVMEVSIVPVIPGIFCIYDVIHPKNMTKPHTIATDFIES